MTYDIFAQRVYEHILYLKSDSGKLRSVNYDVVNGNVADHLAMVAANLKCRILPRILETRRPWEHVDEIEWVRELCPLFKDVFKLYLLNYLEQTDMLPACADDWQKLLDDMEIILQREDANAKAEKLA